VSKKKTQKTKAFDLKRKEIIICPFFRLRYWEYKKNNIAFDMSCSIDDSIFTSYRSSGCPTRRDIEKMRTRMRSACSMECPKMWNQYPNDDETVYGYEDYLYDQMVSDEGPLDIPEFDNDFSKSVPF